MVGGAWRCLRGAVCQTTELVPGGRNIAVTNENVFRYIQLVANYKLNVEINLQAQVGSKVACSPLPPLVCCRPSLTQSHALTASPSLLCPD